MKSEVLVLELKILFGRGGGVIYYTVIYYVKSEVLDLESNLLFLGGRGGGLIYYTQFEGNLLHEIRSALSRVKLTIGGGGG